MPPSRFASPGSVLASRSGRDSLPRILAAIFFFGLVFVYVSSNSISDDGVYSAMVQRYKERAKDLRTAEFKLKMAKYELTKMEKEMVSVRARNRLVKSQLLLLESNTQKFRKDEPTEQPPLKMECAAFDVDSQQIPRVAYVVWKNERLIHEAAVVDRVWKVQEPCFARRVVTDAECATLAEQFPGLKPLYDALPMNVMRADVCRVLVVYFYGGIYMDLDVAWVKPLREWLNISTDIVLGKEYDDGRFFCNWFFAARREHPCLRRVLELVAERINRTFTKQDFADNPWLVHETTGPKTFADALRGCANATLSSAQVNKDYVQHLYGSQRWRDSKGYSSWNVERQRMGGWKSMLGHNMLFKDQQQYLKLNNSALMDNHPGEVLYVERVRQSSYRFPELETMGNPRLAIDNYLESYAQTSSDGENFWEMTFAEPIDLPQLARPGDGSAAGIVSKANETTVIHCVKILNRRDGDFGHFPDVTVEFRAETGRSVYRALPRPDGGIMSVFPFQEEVKNERVSSIRVTRKGEVSFAEVQIFTDPQCKRYRELRLRTTGGAANPFALPEFSSDWASQTRKLFSLLTTRTHHCPDVRILGEKVDDDSQWPLCGLERPMSGAKRGAAIMIQRTTESVLEKDLAEYGFDVHVFDTRFDNKIEVEQTPFGNITRHKMTLQVNGRPTTETDVSIDTLIHAANARHISVLKLNHEGNEWLLSGTLASLAASARIDQLIVEMHICNMAVLEWTPTSVPQMIEVLQVLHRNYYLIGSRYNERSQIVTMPFALPCCMKLSFVRKALLDAAPGTD